ncbi:MAG: UDP-N-acetylmuramate--L-alanine ligase [Acidobacteriota bacterium]|nr:UDP-N-acetylmuramate--L-alanine ligase [Acidobacteriota bacterium]
MFRKPQRLHFIGIGGIGMSGIAEVLLNMQVQITGSDLKEGESVRRLRSLGATVWISHDPSHIKGAQAVVVSSAVRSDNPEIQEARRLGIPVLPRAEMLAELMRLKFGVAVAGSHGKTTTTAMLAQILSAADLDPTLVIGGRLNILDSSARLGNSELMVAEADESDGSFLHLAPAVAVVTNIDHEHLDHYAGYGELQKAFVDFLNKVPFYGVGVVCADDPGVRAILSRLERRHITYGVDAEADLRALEVRVDAEATIFQLNHRGRNLGEVRLRAPGRHNVLNALAAALVALELDVKPDVLCRALSQFSGADRRLQSRGEVAGVLVVDDYGHHPTEIRATLAGIRERWAKRLIVLFQPHRYSRVQGLSEEFASCFGDADVVIATDIYAAGELPRPGVTGSSLAARIAERHPGEVIAVRSVSEAVDEAIRRARSGDLILTLGAGDISKAADLLLDRLTPQKLRSARGTV